MSEHPSNECIRCDGTGQRYPQGGGAPYTCPACQGRGWRGEPINDTQRLAVARAEIDRLKR